MKLALVCAKEDVAYLGKLKHLLSGHKTTVIVSCPDFLHPLLKEYDGILCSQEAFLNVIVQKSGRRVSLSDYAGSFFTREGVGIVILNPFAQCYSLPYGEFLLSRYVSKLISPEKNFQQALPFKWEEVTEPWRFEQLFHLASHSALAIAVDIETVKQPVPAITICSYCLILPTSGGHLSLLCFTFKVDTLTTLSWMKELNALKVPKIFQNGLYDNSWFLRYGTPCVNWAFDTMDMFHSWYSELPKRLDFVTSFCVKDSWFWKNDGKSGKWEDYCEYGCRDVWATSVSWLYMMENLPPWAWKNFKIKFPLNFPVILCNVRGWKIDETRREEIKEIKLPEIEASRKILTDVVGNLNFNPSSPKQVIALLQILSKTPVISSNKDSVAKVSAQHPLNEYICTALTDFRVASKLVSSYLNAELTPNGRFLFSLSPSGTDTGRLSCSSSFLWGGASIQVIPRGSVIKSIFISDDGYLLAEPDAEQAEARCVAYLSGDENLIETVESGKDYHALNAANFFGVPYEEIVSPTGEVLDALLRDLSKRVNHGANYNMGDSMLLITMGATYVLKAKRLLALPSSWSLKQVCKYLLERYSLRYPKVKGAWYTGLIEQVQATQKVTSPLGWTRYFFGKPWKDKPALNALVAHAAQNLNVMIINESMKDLFNFERKTNHGIKLLAQIHDSIPFQYREDREDLAIQAAQIMVRSIKVTDIAGRTRQMVIPISLKAGGKRWSELKTLKFNQEGTTKAGR